MNQIPVPEEAVTAAAKVLIAERYTVQAEFMTEAEMAARIAGRILAAAWPHMLEAAGKVVSREDCERIMTEQMQRQRPALLKSVAAEVAATHEDRLAGILAALQRAEDLLAARDTEIQSLRNKLDTLEGMTSG